MKKLLLILLSFSFITTNISAEEITENIYTESFYKNGIKITFSLPVSQRQYFFLGNSIKKFDNDPDKYIISKWKFGKWQLNNGKIIITFSKTIEKVGVTESNTAEDNSTYKNVKEQTRIINETEIFDIKLLSETLTDTTGFVSVKIEKFRGKIDL